MKANDSLEKLFNNNENWDFNFPNSGHEDRFLKKLNKKTRKKFLFSMTIAASFFISFGIIFAIYNLESEPNVKYSKEMQTTHDYFSSIVEMKKDFLKKNKNSGNKKIVEDAFLELEKLEKDFQLLEKEIIINGENEQIIYAMITNFELRISFLKTVLEKIKENKNTKININEKYT